MPVSTPSAAARQLPPSAVLGGFVLLLALMFAAAYAAGALAGPVNPHLHPVRGGVEKSGHGGGMGGMG